MKRTEEALVERALQSLYTAVYSLHSDSSYRLPELFGTPEQQRWKTSVKYDIPRIKRASDALQKIVKDYKLDKSEVGYLAANLRTYESALVLYGNKGELTKEDAYAITGFMLDALKKVKQHVEKKEAQSLVGTAETVAKAAIIIISTIGLASFLYTQSEPTARVVEPAVANLPLGISLLAILVIAIIAMPRLGR